MSQQTSAPEQSAGAKRAWVYAAGTAIGISSFAIAIVFGNMAAGVPRQPDENGWAHLFQLAMAAQLPLLALYLAIADWTHGRRAFVLLAAQVSAAAAGFGALAWSGY